ncbi:MAG: hypothetical protein H6502_03845 [Candidatus Woesearchaeota archaeon]|nr:MAG: hypothetical protein H6502_03845 [Candidatus Woesearchaeota archaeon]
MNWGMRKVAPLVAAIPLALAVPQADAANIHVVDGTTMQPVSNFPLAVTYDGQTETQYSDLEGIITVDPTTAVADPQTPSRSTHLDFFRTMHDYGVPNARAEVYNIQGRREGSISAMNELTDFALAPGTYFLRDQKTGALEKITLLERGAMPALHSWHHLPSPYHAGQRLQTASSRDGESFEVAMAIPDNEEHAVNVNGADYLSDVGALWHIPGGYTEANRSELLATSMDDDYLHGLIGIDRDGTITQSINASLEPDEDYFLSVIPYDRVTLPNGGESSKRSFLESVYSAYPGGDLFRHLNDSLNVFVYMGVSQPIEFFNNDTLTTAIDKFIDLHAVDGYNFFDHIEGTPTYAEPMSDDTPRHVFFGYDRVGNDFWSLLEPYDPTIIWATHSYEHLAGRNVNAITSDDFVRGLNKAFLLTSLLDVQEGPGYDPEAARPFIYALHALGFHVKPYGSANLFGLAGSPEEQTPEVLESKLLNRSYDSQATSAQQYKGLVNDQPAPYTGE